MTTGHNHFHGLAGLYRGEMMLTSSKGVGADIEAAAIEGFGAGLGGDLLRPGVDGYDAARRLYNGMVDKHPGLIVRCSGVADVLRAVEFGRAHDLLTPFEAAVITSPAMRCATVAWSST
jgi:hypothetical protein